MYLSVTVGICEHVEETRPKRNEKHGRIAGMFSCKESHSVILFASVFPQSGETECLLALSGVGNRNSHWCTSDSAVLFI